MDYDDALLTAIMLRAEWAADAEQIGHYIQRAHLKQHAPNTAVHDRVIMISGSCSSEFAATFTPMRSYCPDCITVLGQMGRTPPKLSQATQLVDPPII